jgi:hypothetical protein
VVERYPLTDYGKYIIDWKDYGRLDYHSIPSNLQCERYPPRWFRVTTSSQSQGSAKLAWEVVIGEGQRLVWGVGIGGGQQEDVDVHEDGQRGSVLLRVRDWGDP